MPIRAKDIAEMLHVSTATLSIVLNNKPGVSDKTRAMILDKIRELNCEYLLRDTVSETPAEKEMIGFVVYKRFGDILEEAPFFNYSLKSITASLKAKNYDLKFIYLDKSASNTEKTQLLVESGCVGLIIYAVEMYEDDLKIFTHTPLPFVLLDNSFQTRDVDCVAINNMQGTRRAMQYLYSMGHREIGYIKSSISITSFMERFREYQHQHTALGLRYNKNYIIEAGYSEASVNEAVDAFLHSQTLPTAFLADNDLLGCYTMQALKRHGVSIPDDVSIIGFDDRPICTLMDPPLTTISIPLTLFGPSAVSLLLTKLQSPRTQSLKLDIGTTLVERQSVRRI